MPREHRNEAFRLVRRTPELESGVILAFGPALPPLDLPVLVGIRPPVGAGAGKHPPPPVPEGNVHRQDTGTALRRLRAKELKLPFVHVVGGVVDHQELDAADRLRVRHRVLAFVERQQPLLDPPLALLRVRPRVALEVPVVVASGVEPRHPARVEPLDRELNVLQRRERNEVAGDEQKVGTLALGLLEDALERLARGKPGVPLPAHARVEVLVFVVPRVPQVEVRVAHQPDAERALQPPAGDVQPGGGVVPEKPVAPRTQRAAGQGGGRGRRRAGRDELPPIHRSAPGFAFRRNASA